MNITQTERERESLGRIDEYIGIFLALLYIYSLLRPLSMCKSTADQCESPVLRMCCRKERDRGNFSIHFQLQLSLRSLHTHTPSLRFSPAFSLNFQIQTGSSRPTFDPSARTHTPDQVSLGTLSLTPFQTSDTTFNQVIASSTSHLRLRLLLLLLLTLVPAT